MSRIKKCTTCKDLSQAPGRTLRHRIYCLPVFAVPSDKVPRSVDYVDLCNGMQGCGSWREVDRRVLSEYAD